MRMYSPSTTEAPAMTLDPEKRKANLRMALVLASIAAAFMVGFIVKMVWLGH